MNKVKILEEGMKKDNFRERGAGGLNILAKFLLRFVKISIKGKNIKN